MSSEINSIPKNEETETFVETETFTETEVFEAESYEEMEMSERSDFILGENDNAKSYFIDSLGDSLADSGINVDTLDFSSFIGNEPIEILVELAKNGKIDPWNIDIVQVTDTFLNKIEELQQMDLRISGRTLLYSCVLLRMKSTGLFQEEEEVLEDLYDIEENYEEEFDINEFNMPLLPVRRSARRPVTLKELIDELKKAEKDVVKRREHIRAEGTRRYIDVELTTEDVMNIAHDEAILKRTGTLLEILKHYFKKQEYVTLDEIYRLEGADKIMDYITLLFLAAMKEVMLYQKEIYGTLYVYPFDEAVLENRVEDIIEDTLPETAEAEAGE
ncbi:Segregation and condensation protein A [Methanimicrococcus hongohii]|uniref:Segregation and condensation protein A n=1 Tax=Methanimicrococcus hongohii TaxID=3028295 RepID=A0AA96ZTJ3_9EURY|nr:ScpA family protein [Methanimicrococcus sp. Hf6]WNY23286.1 Segregation and condensation protein A [Methanimicrococcus sp. Hf6]